MLKRVLGVLLLGACIALPGVAVAQERAPHAGSTAVGVDATVSFRTEAGAVTGLVIRQGGRDLAASRDVAE